MRYKRSSSRIAFDDRIGYLTKKAAKANKFDRSQSDLRDLVFQCCILYFSAALETYIKLVIETWIFSLSEKGKKAENIPPRARAYTAMVRLSSHFNKYSFNGNEREINQALEKEIELWPFLCGSDALHKGFKIDLILKDTKYPSTKNIKRLFSRLGVDNIFDELGRICKTDVEFKIDSFQSLRTALAHESPPDVTIGDVRKYGKDMKTIVGALDRVICLHLSNISGKDCWS